MNKDVINQHDAEGRRHGVWEDYWYNGKLERGGHYHHGRHHGVWEWYYSNGKLRWRVHWHYGVMKGLATRGDSQGRITHKTYHLVIR